MVSLMANDLITRTTTQRKWETDLGYAYDMEDWHHLLELTQTVLISTKQANSIQYTSQNILHPLQMIHN